MKKHLLKFSLILSIGLLPTLTFAQDAPGTSGGDMGSSIDGGTTIDGGVSTPIIINPPGYVSNVKRNNGNGTSAGLADARLNFSDNNYHPVKLIDIRNLDGSALKGGNVVMDGTGTFQRGYLSYALHFNVAPKNKLLFHFQGEGGDFWIPEL